MCSAAVRHSSASRPPQLHVFHPPAQSSASCFAAWHYCLSPRSKLGNKTGAMSAWLQSVDLTQLLLIAHQMPLVQSTALVSFTGGCLCWTLQVWKIHLWSPLSKDFSAHTWHLRAVCFRRTWQWDGMLPLSCSGKLSAGCLTWPRGTYEKGPSECKAEKKLKNFWDPGKLHNSSIFRLKGKKKGIILDW